VCVQVARCASSPLGDAVAREGLPLGASRAASEALLLQTAQAGALEAQLSFQGVQDVRRDVATAARGERLAGDALVRVATTLAAAARLAEALRGAGAELGTLAEALLAPPASLAATLLRSLSQPGGALLDAASPELAAVRLRRRQTGRKLRALLGATAQLLLAAGAAETAQVVSRRARLCVPVRRGLAQQHLPGCVVLDESTTGATLFCEPAEAVALNNDAALLEARHAVLERQILEELTAQVGAQQAVPGCLNALAALDMALARWRHAAWLGAHPPRFSSAGDPPACLRGSCHPLLLGSALAPPPPRWWELEAAEAEAAAAELAAPPGGASPSAVTPPPSRPAPPVPVDWMVPPGVSCVVVTGPNTGGKTASMKTLALCSLLARCGAFPPAQPGAVLPWPRTVLADLGDGQSLAQGLSTFSGHVQRLSHILAAAGQPGCGAGSGQGELEGLALVLLDEPGGGTDPEEGAALAAALLRRLSACRALTVATSHYEGAKRLAEEQPGRFVNAAVEFDDARMAPTYRLLWGVSGRSYALDTARAAGLPRELLEAAERMMAAEEGAPGGGDRASAQLLAQRLRAQLQQQSASAAAAAAERARAEAHAEQLALRAQALLPGERALAAAADAEARRAEAEALAAFAAVVASPEPDAALAAALEAHLPPGWQLAGGGAVRRSDGAAQHSTAWAPAAGERVRVPRLGGRVATVLSCALGEVELQLGVLVSRVPLTEVLPEHAAQDGEEPESDEQLAARREAQAKRFRAARLTAPKVSRSSAALAEAERVTPQAASAADVGSLVATQRAENTVDVRGMYPTEAVAAVEAEVQARGRRRGASALYVIHGVGTGKVKAAVTDFLRTCPLVMRCQPATQREGGAGCTLAFLR